MQLLTPWLVEAELGDDAVGYRLSRTDVVREEVVCDGGRDRVKVGDEERSWGSSDVVQAEGGADGGEVVFLDVRLGGGKGTLRLLD